MIYLIWHVNDVTTYQVYIPPQEPLDEWLLNDMTEIEQHFIFELIEHRYDCTSTIFCTQYKREDWHSRLGGGIHADA